MAKMIETSAMCVLVTVLDGKCKEKNFVVCIEDESGYSGRMNFDELNLGTTGNQDIDVTYGKLSPLEFDKIEDHVEVHVVKRNFVKNAGLGQFVMTMFANQSDQK